MSDGDTAATYVAEPASTAAVLNAVAAQLPPEVSKWRIIESQPHSFDPATLGFEVETPGVVLSDDVRLRVQGVIDRMVPAAFWCKVTFSPEGI